MKLIGIVRLGRDAEVRYTPSGVAVCEFSAAYNFGRKAEGDAYRPSQWVDFRLWGDRGEKLAAHLTKGTAVLVCCDDVHVEPYLRKSDQEPAARVLARVIDLEFAGARPQEAATAPAPSGPPPTPLADKPAQHAAPAAAGMRSTVGRSRPASGGAFDDMDSDIPF